MKTRDGKPVTIETRNKPGMSIFLVFGTCDGKPCHWTAKGRYRADDKDDDLDIMDFEARP